MIGVYVLLDGDDVLYVGKSINVESRLNCHVDKGYDKYVVFPMIEKYLECFETAIISVLNPKLNKYKRYRRMIEIDEIAHYVQYFGLIQVGSIKLIEEVTKKKKAA